MNLLVDPKELGITLNNQRQFKRKKCRLYNSMKKQLKFIKVKSMNFSVAVALNVAAGLIVSGEEYSFINAFEKATKHLNSGNVFEHLIKIQSS